MLNSFSYSFRREPISLLFHHHLLLGQHKAFKDLIIDPFTPIEIELTEHKWITIVIKNVQNLSREGGAVLQTYHLQMCRHIDELRKLLAHVDGLEYRTLALDNQLFIEIWLMQSM